MSFKLPGIWTDHLEGAENKEEFTELYVRSLRVIERLRDIIEKDIHDLTVKMTSRENYKHGSWECEQADYIGAIRQLKRLENLLKTIDK